MYKFTFFVLLLIFSFAGMGQSTPQSPGGLPAAKIVKFFPNPATTYINFEFIKFEEKTYTLQVYNFLGKKILDIQELTPLTRVNLTNLNRGFYIFQLRDRTGKVVESGKFQLEK